MNMETIIEFHKKIGAVLYNLESGCRDKKVEYVKPGIKSESQKLIEASRDQVHDLIDTYIANIMYEVGACLKCIPSPFCGSFVDKETCVKCYKDQIK